MKLKKKIAFFLMLLVIIGAVFYGMGKTMSDGRADAMELYGDNYDISIRSAVTETVDKIENLMKLARKYTADDSELEALCQGVESKIAELDLETAEQADPQKLKELYALTNTLSEELQKVTLDAQDQKYPVNLMVEIFSLQDQMSHAEYNDKAREWNAKLEKFPGTLFKTLKIDGKPLFSATPLYDYSSL